MSLQEMKTHMNKVDRIKFFVRKHEELQKFRDGLGCSIFIDNSVKEDTDMLNMTSKICRFLENKILGG